MIRIDVRPRDDFQAIVESQGLIWHTAEQPYWHESACYVFTEDQIATIERATSDLHQMFVKAGEHLVANPDLLTLYFDIPEAFIPAIIASWNDEGTKMLNYGRFDLGFDGNGVPKLFEYNCDTPTSMLEAGVIQWLWKEDVFPDNDQFNALHERMVDAYRRLGVKNMHFAGIQDDAGEDAVTIGYHMDLAAEAGISPSAIMMQDIGFDSEKNTFVDLSEQPIEFIFKLYPWEWLVEEEFGKHILEADTVWIEPIWKMIWSNKAILPILWQLFPNHPLLLEASFSPLHGDHVVKPTLAREGANITIHRGFEKIETQGIYEGRKVYQRLYDLPCFDGLYPVIGSWCVDGWAAGIGIREAGLITDNKARFTPHIIG